VTVKKGQSSEGKRNSPKTEKRFLGVSIDASLWEMIQKASENEHRSISNMVSCLLRRALDLLDK